MGNTPPQITETKVYWIVRGEEKYGPFDKSDLISCAENGSVVETDQVWKHGWPVRRPIGEMVFMAGKFRKSEPEPEPEPVVVAAATPPTVLTYEGPSSPTGIVATAKSLEMLRQTKPWVWFMGILLFIGGGLMVVGGLIASVVIGAAGGRSAGFGAGMSLTYVLLGLLYIGPAIFLTRYGGNIGRLMVTRDSRTLEAALEAQKSFWKFVGIMTAVVISVWLVLLLLALVAAAM